MAARAEELLKEAEKHMGKKAFFGLMKSKPNYEGAADAFQQAAALLRSPAVKDPIRAVKAFEDAAAAHRNAGSLGFAAACLEDAGNVLRDQKQVQKASIKYLEASEVHKSAGNFEKAADSLLKAAKVSADEEPDNAITAYLDAITILEDEEKHIFISDAWRACLSLMLRNNKVDEAITFLLRMCPTFVSLKQPEYLRKAQLSVIVLQLSQADTVAASCSLEGFGEFQIHQEGEAAADLIEAFENGDEDGVKKLTSTQSFTLLENQVGRVAHRLKDVCREAASDLTGGGGRPRGGGSGGSDQRTGSLGGERC